MSHAQGIVGCLSVITEEEQRILDEQRGIDPQLYTEKKELIVDKRKIVEKREADTGTSTYEIC